MIELADVFRRHAPEYLAQRSVPAHHRRAIRAILGCRTCLPAGTAPEQGGHLYACSDCGGRHYGCHSCNHRSCPKCGGADAEAWRERQQARLLPVPYFLVTFTLPEELRALCRANPQLCYTLLFEESAGTLKDISANPRHLGAEPGFLGVLHTWTRQLAYHPHLHYVVAGGGLRADGRKWRKCRNTGAGEPYLLPVKVLSRRFRNRFAQGLRERAPELYREVPRGVWEKEWIVHSQHAGSGREALGYLSGYVFRTALSNKRLLADKEGRVTFGYTESGTGKRRRLKLDAMTFISRVLSHVLPDRFHKVRYFGWMHPVAGRRRMVVETLLAVPLILSRRVEPPKPAWHLRCPHCGKPSLKIVGRFRKPRPP